MKQLLFTKKVRAWYYRRVSSRGTSLKRKCPHGWTCKCGTRTRSLLMISLVPSCWIWIASRAGPRRPRRAPWTCWSRTGVCPQSPSSRSSTWRDGGLSSWTLRKRRSSWLWVECQWDSYIWEFIFSVCLIFATPETMDGLNASTKRFQKAVLQILIL